MLGIMKKSVKHKKNVKKTPKKRKKNGFSDAIKAFLLAGVIVAVSAVISFTFIMIHSSLNNKSEAESQENISHIDDTDDIIPPPIEIITEPKVDPVPVNRQSGASRPAQNNAAQNQTAQNNAAQNNTAQNNTAQSQSAQNNTAQNQTAQNNAAQTQSAPSSSAVIQAPAEANKGIVVFVIDDAGNNLAELEPFLQIPFPLTIAVLPALPYSAEAARRIRAAGKEVILHQPMEAIGAQEPGPGAIYSGMSAREIRTILARNVSEVGPVRGINNHQGSKITMDREMMQTILEFCAENGLYFLDSRTTPESVVPEVAQTMGMKIAQRNVFIDNEQSKDSMLAFITGGLARAQRSGSAVMIGHTWSKNLAPLLKEQHRHFTEQGYAIKTVSDFLR